MTPGPFQSRFTRLEPADAPMLVVSPSQRDDLLPVVKHAIAYAEVGLSVARESGDRWLLLHHQFRRERLAWLLADLMDADPDSRRPSAITVEPVALLYALLAVAEESTGRMVPELYRTPSRRGQGLIHLPAARAALEVAFDMALLVADRAAAGEYVRELRPDGRIGYGVIDGGWS